MEGPVRVSSFDQNPERQLEDQSLDHVFNDKASGKDINRPQLEALLKFVRLGDTVVIHSMDCLARNLDDLRSLVHNMNNRGIKVQFVKEGLLFTGEDSPMSKLMLSVLGAFAEFERSLIKERQLEGFAIAKQKGMYKGRKKSLSAEQQLQLMTRVQNGEQQSKLALELHISRETLYKYIRG